MERLLSTRELAEYLGVSVSTIYDWRTRGLGPRGHRVGKHLRYEPNDVKRWLEDRRDDDQPAA